MKILVTGADGYVGTNLLPALTGDVFSLDRKGSSGPGSICQDIRSEDLDLSDFDLIFHLAAISSSRLTEKDRELAWDVNVNGTQNLCRKMRKNQKLIFLSTAQVYGAAEKRHMETELPNPSNYYALTKLAGEEIIRYYARQIGFQYVIFRLFNSYSESQPPGLLVGDVIRKFRASEEAEMLDPDSVLDMVHIKDAVSVLAGALKIPDGTYNICSSHPVTVREVYCEIGRFLGIDKALKEKRGKKGLLIGDNARLRSLGFSFRKFSLP